MTKSNDDWTDEELSAYLDGALDADKAAFLEQQISADEALAAKVQALASANDAIKIAFDAPLQDDVPERYRQILEANPQSAQTSAVIAQFPGRERAVRAIDWRLPMAAGIALVVGAIGGGVGGSFLSTDSPALISRLEPALSNTPSAITVAIGADGAFKPILTFVAGDGRYCREFELSQFNESFVGVACNAGGAWQLEAILAAQTDIANANTYRQATAHAGAAIDEVLSALDAGEPLSAADEAELITRGFTTSAR